MDAAAAIYHAFNEFIDSGRWLKFLLFICGAMLIVMLVRLQHGDNKFDVKDLLLEDGKASPRRMITMGAFLATTWVLIVLANQNQLQEWYFNGYSVAWILNGAVLKYIDAKALTTNPPPQTPTNVTVSAAPGTAVNVGTTTP